MVEYRAINYGNYSKCETWKWIAWRLQSSMKRGTLAGKQQPTGKQGHFVFVIGTWIVWLIAEYYLGYKYVPVSKAVHCLLAGKHTSRGWDHWRSQDIDVGWFNTRRSQCRESVRSRALRSGYLGSSEWGTPLHNTGQYEHFVTSFQFLPAASTS